MAIQRTDPMRDLARLRESVNRMFDEALSRSPERADASPAGLWRPAVDLFEEPGHYVVRSDLPGVLATDVDIRVERGMLRIRGERKPDGDASRAAHLRIERPAGPFAAEIALPGSIDPQRIHANHRNGVLEIVLPKRKGDSPGRIDVAGD
jgi:HSP20 family protein